MILRLLKNKRFILVFLIAAAVAAYFWSSSRYPALNEKAMMGTDTHLEAIGFDVLLPVSEKDSIPKKILYNGINWMQTNRKGMTFGIIFGALLMTLLPFLQKLQLKSRFANTLLGVLYGAPLGLCVNCSTPVAQGVFKASGRVETMLATMVSSPTLNIIVISMLFAFFPFYLVAIKISATIIFILVIIPLLSRYFYPEPTAIANLNEKITKLEINTDCVSTEECDDETNESLLAAIKWVIVNILKNLWYIIKTTVPLMILAGFLGAAVITLLPFDSIIGILPEGRITGLIGMLVLAVFGLFLPVPMAFDIIVSAILINAGVPVKYVAVLLFTLGIFSVYPFSMIGKTLTWKFATSIFIVLACFGMFVGMVASRFYQWETAKQEKYIYETFVEKTYKSSVIPAERTPQGEDQQILLADLQKTALKPEILFRQNELSVSAIPFAAKNGTDKPMFTRIDGESLGIKEDGNYSEFKDLLRYSVSRGIASGDVHHDGWVDLVIASDSGLGLYANQQGHGFIQQRIDIPEVNSNLILNVALVDLNSDGWLDLYFSVFRRGHFVIYNQKGAFLKENLKQLPNQPKAFAVGSPAFGDINQDGSLDIVLGNVSNNKIRTDGSFDSSENVLLLQNKNKDFEIKPLEGINGETLTTLLTDFNNDGNLDLAVGNDIAVPDFYYLGDGKGGFKMLTKADQFIPYSTSTTMSLTTADIDNDLQPELYLGQVARREKMGMPGHTQIISTKERCAEINNDDKRNECEKFYNYHEIMKNAISPGNIFDCNLLTDEKQHNACVAYKILSISRLKNDEKYCEVFSAGWEPFSYECHTFFTPVSKINQEKFEKAIPQKMGINILFKKNNDGKFEDKATDFGLELGGWTWNAKFADLNNDGWQDIFIVNGYSGSSRSETNYLYVNQGGKKFQDVTEESGMKSFLDTVSYTYIDFDNDGDLDIVAVPTVGPISVYINNTQTNNSVSFELHDNKANYFGIGSKIYIFYGENGKQMREIQSSGGYQSFDAPIAHFGLGEETKINRVEINWSNGEKSVISQEFKAGSQYTITREK